MDNARTPGPFPDGQELLNVTADSIVLVVAAKFARERAVLFRDWLVPVVATPLPKGSTRAADAVLRGASFNRPTTATGASPVVGESDKVECALPTTR
jgi:hypothetical protein